MWKFVIEVVIHISVGCLSCQHDNQILRCLTGYLGNRFLSNWSFLLCDLGFINSVCIPGMNFQPSVSLVHVCLLSHFQPFATLWTLACQIPLSTGFSRKEYWSGLPCPPPGDLADPEIEPPPMVHSVQVGSLPLVLNVLKCLWRNSAFSPTSPFLVCMWKS